MTLDRCRFENLIPHRGSMCLIERVLNWDGQAIVCASAGHRDPAHPLRGDDGRLGCCIGLEYAAQAAAVHGGLLAEQAGVRPPAGYLAGTRALRLRRRWLDDLEDELIVRAERLLGSEQSLLYGFGVTCGGEPVCEGRLSVFFDLRP
ncbi:MAG: 3-hydroxylacyl-ACP dehydratase [Methylococcaceae bacterium]|nr:3-hydroxylacyl-ACP dehydratase [Methylococcaceae bacterium]